MSIPFVESAESSSSIRTSSSRVRQLRVPSGVRLRPSAARWRTRGCMASIRTSVTSAQVHITGVEEGIARPTADLRGAAAPLHMSRVTRMVSFLIIQICIFA